MLGVLLVKTNVLAFFVLLTLSIIHFRVSIDGLSSRPFAEIM